MTARPSRPDSIELPVLKAWNRIIELVDCVDQNPYDRDGLREAILNLFPAGRTEKSVFRGMAIPTLRRLGLIIGFEDLIRLGANGKLIAEAHRISEATGKRALALIIYEMDKEGPRFVEMLEEKGTISEDQIVTDLAERVNAPTGSSKKERIIDWLGLLELCNILIKQDGCLTVDQKTVDRLSNDANSDEKQTLFAHDLMESYLTLVNLSRGLQSQPIEDLRIQVALSFLKRREQFLTEKQFDQLLSQIPKTSPEYLISFGRPMGADEKLFQLDGKYYQTISIQKLTR